MRLDDQMYKIIDCPKAKSSQLEVQGLLLSSNLRNYPEYEIIDITLQSDAQFAKVHGRGEQFWCTVNEYNSDTKLWTFTVDNYLVEKHPFEFGSKIYMRNNIDLSKLCPCL